MATVKNHLLDSTSGQTQATNAADKVSSVYQHGTALSTHSEKQLQSIWQNIETHKDTVKQAETDLKTKDEEHEVIKAEIEAHNQKIFQAKAALSTADKAVSHNKLVASQATIDEAKAKDGLNDAESNTAAAKSTLEASEKQKAESEAGIEDVLKPAHTDTSARVVESATALQVSSESLANTKKEIDDAQAAG